mmetsp:Transcript_51832/g.130170  ORF Transcript_51832/g.130170 Transcript_51832/m.130170 type:complete len:284 (+) Transcript_51832:474-1325(+)
MSREKHSRHKHSHTLTHSAAPAVALLERTPHVHEVVAVHRVDAQHRVAHGVGEVGRVDGWRLAGVIPALDPRLQFAVLVAAARAGAQTNSDTAAAHSGASVQLVVAVYGGAGAAEGRVKRRAGTEERSLHPSCVALVCVCVVLSGCRCARHALHLLAGRIVQHQPIGAHGGLEPASEVYLGLCILDRPNHRINAANELRFVLVVEHQVECLELRHAVEVECQQRRQVQVVEVRGGADDGAEVVGSADDAAVVNGKGLGGLFTLQLPAHMAIHHTVEGQQRADQ